MSQDINYVESITTTLQAIVNEDNEEDWDLFLSAEKETIINSYCSTHLSAFKGVWKRRFKEVASILNFRIKNDSGDANNWQTLICGELRAKRKASSISESTTSTTSTKSVHNNSISAYDKKIAITYLESLPVEEKWRLKSGRFVEDIVMQAIDDSTFEHPCLSYIVDLEDPIWPNYFSPEEADEIRTYNSVELPGLQDEIQNCINIYDNNTLKTEVGKHDVLVIDDKYLDDGMVKLPGTIRDMLCVLVEANPHKINQLYAIGFLIMGLSLELFIMNVPAGKTVTRITRSRKLPFPGKPKNIRLDFLPLLEVTLIGKVLMENLARIIDDRKRKAVELNTAEKATSPCLPFSFVGKSSV